MHTCNDAQDYECKFNVCVVVTSSSNFYYGPDALSAENWRVHAGQTAVVRHKLQPIIWLIISCYVLVVESNSFYKKMQWKWHTDEMMLL